MRESGGKHLNEQPPIDGREQAERCRRLSRATYDRATSEMLNRLAETFERGSPSSTPTR